MFRADSKVKQRGLAQDVRGVLGKISPPSAPNFAPSYLDGLPDLGSRYWLYRKQEQDQQPKGFHYCLMSPSLFSRFLPSKKNHVSVVSHNCHSVSCCQSSEKGSHPIKSFQLRAGLLPKESGCRWALGLWHCLSLFFCVCLRLPDADISIASHEDTAPNMATAPFFRCNVSN